MIYISCLERLFKVQISKASKIHNCFISTPERGQWGEMPAKSNLCVYMISLSIVLPPWGFPWNKVI